MSVRRTESADQPPLTKQQLRAQLRSRRQQMPRSAALHEQCERQLVALVTQLQARRVSCYVSYGSEPDTRGFLRWALRHGVSVLLPRMLPEAQLAWVEFTGADFVPGPFGVPEPCGVAVPQKQLLTLDAMIVPAAAVDLDGGRLGWGRGYFDRALAAVQSKCALPAAVSNALPVAASDVLPAAASDALPAVFAHVFSAEVLPRVPTQTHDRPVSGVITECGWQRFSVN